MFSMRAISSQRRRSPVKLNQYGGTIGGPIRKDKTHFFATWEQTRQLTSFDTTSTVPTLLNARAISRICASTAGNLIQIYDPATGSTAATRQPFPGNVIPAHRIDPVASGCAELLPAAQSRRYRHQRQQLSSAAAATC